MSQDHYDLFSDTDLFLTRTRIPQSRKSSLYPSEASVSFLNQHGEKTVYGKCLRAVYLRLMKEVEPLPNNARSEFIFLHGKDVENMLVKVWQKMGLWVDNSVRFFNEKYNLSGEIDVVLREPDGTKYGIEVKSFYGYHGKSQLFGNTKKKGFPKWAQLIQTLIYCHEFKDYIPYFRMAYFARDTVDRKTFFVETKFDESGIERAYVDGELVNEFTVDDIYARLETLSKHLAEKDLPEMDYQLQYSDDKIECLAARGEVGKTKLEKWRKGKLKYKEYIGDWQCAYCEYRHFCHGNSAI